MHKIETAFLFSGKPLLAFEHFLESLNARLKRLDVEFSRAATDTPGEVAMSAPDMRMTVTARNCPLPAASFDGALEGMISEPFRGPLSDVLRRHSRYMILALTPMPGEGVKPSPQQRLHYLRVAHVACGLIAELHQPGAVHWRQSGQLLLGAQYLSLAREITPWPLFARARLTAPQRPTDATANPAVLRIEDAAGLIDRPIEALLGDDPAAAHYAYAAALAFLRHAVETGAIIGDGDRFGPSVTESVTVSHVDGTVDEPSGLYRLSVAPVPPHGSISGASTAAALAGIQSRLRADARTAQAERRNGLRLSALMLVLMPPLGLVLMVLNAVMGANYLRTAAVTLGAVALALLVAAWMTVGGGLQIRANALDANGPISVLHLE